jgi:hypothetical protein
MEIKPTSQVGSRPGPRGTSVPNQRSA